MLVTLCVATTFPNPEWLSRRHVPCMESPRCLLNPSHPEVPMKTLLRIASTAALAAFAFVPATASAQVWTSWTGPVNPCATSPGTIDGDMGGVSVSVSGQFNGYQLASGATCGGPITANGNGTSYYYHQNNLGNPYGAYTQGGLNAPLEFGLIQYNAAVSTATITFGSAVLNPFIAFVSVGQGGVPVTYDFGANTFSVVSHNTGFTSYWGGGTHSVAGNTITGNEFSGVLQFDGAFTSITFSTNNPENWHGITVGAQSVVPEPSTYLLMASGLAGILFFTRRRKA